MIYSNTITISNSYYNCPILKLTIIIVYVEKWRIIEIIYFCTHLSLQDSQLPLLYVNDILSRDFCES